MSYPGHVRNGVVVLDEPVRLPDGTAVRVELAEGEDVAKELDWACIPTASFTEDWDNDQDAVYDDWRERYGVRERCPATRRSTTP